MQLNAQEEAPKVDTVDVAGTFIKAGNYKCDSAAVRLKNNDTKTANKFYLEAIKEYKKALKANSGSAEAHYRLALVQTKKKDYKNAVAEYKNLLVKDPTYIQAYTRLGKIYYEQIKDINKAKYYLEKGYNKELEQTGYTTYDTDMLYYLGMIAVKEEKKLEAILYFMDLKSNAGYYEDAVKKKTKLLKEIKKLDE